MCRGQVRGSCSYLWANTACLFSAGKHGLLHKCAHRSGVRADIYFITKMTSLYFFLRFFVSLLEDVQMGDVISAHFLHERPQKVLHQAASVNVFVLHCYASHDGLFLTRRHSASHFIFVWTLGQSLFLILLCCCMDEKKEICCFMSSLFQVPGSSLF